MPLGTGYPTQDCPIARTLEVVGERWSLLIIRDLFYGVARFSDFRSHLSVSRGVLAQRLDDLVAQRVVEKFSDTNGSERYRLTATGKLLWPVIWSLVEWGNAHCMPEGRQRIFSHAVCGSTLNLRGGCPKCGVFPEPSEIVISPRPMDAKTDPVSEALREGPHRLLEPLDTKPYKRKERPGGDAD